MAPNLNFDNAWKKQWFCLYCFFLKHLQFPWNSWCLLGRGGHITLTHHKCLFSLSLSPCTCKSSSSLFLALGAAYGTAKSGTGIAAMSVMRPELIMKSIIPVVMAGIIAIYGLVVAVLIANNIAANISLFKWVTYLTSVLSDFPTSHCQLSWVVIQIANYNNKKNLGVPLELIGNEFINN